MSSRDVPTPSECPPLFGCCAYPYEPHSDVVNTVVLAPDRQYRVPPSVVVFQRLPPPHDRPTDWPALKESYGSLRDPRASAILRREPGLTGADLTAVLDGMEHLRWDTCWACCDAVSPSRRAARPWCCRWCIACDNWLGCCVCWTCVIGTCVATAPCMCCHLSAFEEHNTRLYVKHLNDELAARSDPPVRARWGLISARGRSRTCCCGVPAPEACQCGPMWYTDLILHLEPHETFGATARAAQAWHPTNPLLQPPDPTKFLVQRPPLTGFEGGHVLCPNGHVCVPVSAYEAAYRTDLLSHADHKAVDATARCPVCERRFALQQFDRRNWAHCTTCQTALCHDCTLRGMRDAWLERLHSALQQHAPRAMPRPVRALVVDYVVGGPDVGVGVWESQVLQPLLAKPVPATATRGVSAAVGAAGLAAAPAAAVAGATAPAAGAGAGAAAGDPRGAVTAP